MTKIFVMPTTDYYADQDTHAVEPFDPEVEYSGKKIVGFQFGSNDYVSCNAWIEMFIQVIKDLYDQYPDKINNIVLQEGSLGKLFKTDDGDGNYRKISDGIYAWRHNSTWSKVHMLRLLFDALEVPYDELGFRFPEEAKAKLTQMVCISD